MAELPKGKRSSGLGRPRSGESWAWTVHCEAEAGPVQAFARQEAGPGEADWRSSPGPEEVAQRRHRGYQKLHCRLCQARHLDTIHL